MSELKRWDGGEFRVGSVIRRWNGTAWVPPLGGAATYNFLGGLTPEQDAADDAGPITLGTRFVMPAGKKITALLFYKGAGNDGVHKLGLYGDGLEIVPGTNVTGETGHGWQRMAITPVASDPGISYVVAYFCPNRGYSFTADVHYPITVNGCSAQQGLYTYQTYTLPNSSSANASFFVDIEFEDA